MRNILTKNYIRRMIYQQLNETIDKTQKLDNNRLPLSPPSDPTFADIPLDFPTWDMGDNFSLSDEEDTADLEKTEFDDRTAVSPDGPWSSRGESDFERTMRLGQLIDQDLPSATADDFLMPGESREQMTQRVLDRINQLQRDIKEGRFSNKKILTRKLIQLSICESIYRSLI